MRVCVCLVSTCMDEPVCVCVFHVPRLSWLGRPAIIDGQPLLVTAKCQGSLPRVLGPCVLRAPPPMPTGPNPHGPRLPAGSAEPVVSGRPRGTAGAGVCQRGREVRAAGSRVPGSPSSHAVAAVFHHAPRTPRSLKLAELLAACVAGL